ncbi:MAG: hypothetical protein EPN47_10875 [Acidobacteria bacterium]|nr:MAG: hypothetical protein EPN47_10875 [Acidobacteriota bacterium]
MRSNQINRHLEKPATRFDTPCAPSEAGQGVLHEVNVIFTGNGSSRHALRAAGNLARDLGVRLRFIVLRAVPYALPLNKPPVPAEFTERKFKALAEGIEIESHIDVLICNCRSRQVALAKILPPDSVVVIGGLEKWWPTKASRLAARLQSEGHEVILVGRREDAHVGSFLSVRWCGVLRHLLGLHEGL